MILFKYHDYTISQPIHCKLDMFLTLEQNLVNLMTKEICNVDNTKSLELKVLSKEPSAHVYIVIRSANINYSSYWY
jgi:hypothetical protein